MIKEVYYDSAEEKPVCKRCKSIFNAKYSFQFLCYRCMSVGASLNSMFEGFFLVFSLIATLYAVWLVVTGQAKEKNRYTKGLRGELDSKHEESNFVYALLALLLILALGMGVLAIKKTYDRWKLANSDIITNV